MITDGDPSDRHLSGTGVLDRLVRIVLRPERSLVDVCLILDGVVPGCIKLPSEALFVALNVPDRELSQSVRTGVLGWEVQIPSTTTPCSSARDPKGISSVISVESVVFCLLHEREPRRRWTRYLRKYCTPAAYIRTKPWKC